MDFVKRGRVMENYKNSVVTEATNYLPTEGNPVAAIRNEVEQAEHRPQTIGILAVKSANQWVSDAVARPDPRSFFHGLFYEYENTILFASSNAGKSILAVQIAEEIARTDSVLYIDLELSDKQFQHRYSDPETGAMSFTGGMSMPDLSACTELEVLSFMGLSVESFDLSYFYIPFQAFSDQ